MTFSSSRRPLSDIADDTSTKATIAVGGSFTGQFETPGDSDWIAVTLVEGVTYAINLGPGAANAAVPFDTTLGIYDATGALVAFNDDVGETAIYNPGVGGVANPWNTYSYIEFAPTETGTFYLAAGAFDNGPDIAIGDYVMSIFADDLPYGNDTPAVLQSGGASLTSRLDYSGDVDSFKVTTTTGEYYTASITWSGGDYSQFVVPLLQASGAEGIVIDTAVNGGYLTMQFIFQASSPQTRLDVTSFFPGYDVGQYTIHVEEASLVDSVENAFWVPLPANIKVYFPENVWVTNSYGETYFAPVPTEVERGGVTRALQQYSEVANLSFELVDDPAQADLFLSSVKTRAPKVSRPRPFCSERR